MPKILVVENEAVISIQLEEFLESHGYEVAGTACSGEEAVEKGRMLKPDLILGEAHLPGKMDGISAASILQQDLDIPFVFVTVYSDHQVAEKANHMHTYRTLTKPIRDNDLIEAIEQFV